jgi:hypothetical protein
VKHLTSLIPSTFLLEQICFMKFFALVEVPDLATTLYYKKPLWIGQLLVRPAATANQASCQALFSRDDINIDQQLQHFWTIESCEQPILSPEHKSYEHFTANTTRQNDGRFAVRLPFKMESKELGKSRKMAEQRLLQIERRMSKGEELKIKCHAFVHEYQQLRHIQPAEPIISDMFLFAPSSSFQGI